MVDREKVIKGLERCKLYNKVNCDKCPYDYNGRGNGKSECTAELASDALALLKEQEEIVPYIDIDEAKCPVCKVKLTRQELLGDDVLFEDFFDYCPHCGRKVKWDA